MNLPLDAEDVNESAPSNGLARIIHPEAEVGMPRCGVPAPFRRGTGASPSDGFVALGTECSATERGGDGAARHPYRGFVASGRDREIPGLAELPPFDDEDVVRHGADAHHVLVDPDGAATARCSLWWRDTPALTGHRIGLIGHYAASCGEAGETLLEQACGELRANGCTLAVGPMDGSTWRPYRFVTELGKVPPFLLEPENPPEWPRYFEGAGFKPLANYYSSVTDRLDYEDPKARIAEQRLNALGVKLRPLEMNRWEQELREVYRITLACFQGSFLYQPQPESQFFAQCRQLQPFVRPELILFAMHHDRTVGFVFNIPDVLQTRRGGSIDTVILKTFAIVPDRSYAGLGSYLAQQTHRIARELGYRRVIHALMHEKNMSLNISARYANPFRRYVLFARPL